jgi:hypothetical protein
MEIRIMAISLASLTGGGGANDFFLIVGSTGHNTYVLDRGYVPGRYEIKFTNSETAYDIYVIAKDGSYAGHTNGVMLQAFADFYEIVVLGATANNVIYFTYKGESANPSRVGDVVTAGAFVSSAGTSSLPNIDDSTVLIGGNFSDNVEVIFIGQSGAEFAPKSIVRSSTTQLVITRPDDFSTDESPYTVKVVNPGIPVPSSTNAYLMSNAITAGTNPVWQTSGNLLYNIASASPEITLLATDTEATDIDYSVVSGSLPAGITLDGETGVISGTFSGSSSDGALNSVTFRAVDAGGNFLDKAFNFVANAAPVWTTTAGNLSTAPEETKTYNLQLVASGGDAGGTLSYILQSGALPSGLSMNALGLITGTCDSVGDSVHSFTIRVSDSFGLFSDREFTTTIIKLDAVIGGTKTISGGYNYHTFSSDSTLQINHEIALEMLIVAGGGGGSSMGGGGGGGGYIAEAVTMSPGDYSVVIGSGGGTGGNGGNSSLNDSIAIGGGRGSYYQQQAAGSGGSGGGGGNGSSYGGNGTSGQGYRGGGSSDYAAGGGGGGAGQEGGRGANQKGGEGGNGRAWLNGTTYSGGGHGHHGYQGSYPTSNGSGQGNAGGGGEGRYYHNGKAGIVIVRYPV